MLRRFSVEFALFSMALDGLLVMLALRLATLARPSLTGWLGIAKAFGAPPQFEWWLYPIFGGLWMMVLLLFGVYDGRRHFYYAEEISSLILGCLLATVMTAGLLCLGYRDFSRALFLSFVGIAILLLLFVHSFYRLYFRISSHPSNGQIQRVLILGAGPVGTRLAQNLRQYQNFGLELIGFLDDDPRKQCRKEVLGDLEQLTSSFRHRRSITPTTHKPPLASPSNTPTRLPPVPRLRKIPLPQASSPRSS